MDSFKINITKMLFKNREEAGEKLAKSLKDYKAVKDVLVLGIPRGGVAVAYKVAKELNAPLDIVVTRKIGHPQNREFAIAAVDEVGSIIRDEGFLSLDVDEHYISEEARAQRKEIIRRLKKFRGEEKHLDVKDKICLIVDDGIATGLTIKSAIKFLKNEGAKKTVVAVPVMPIDKLHEIEEEADEVIALEKPQIFLAVGQFYEDFPQTSDEEVAEFFQKD